MLLILFELFVIIISSLPILSVTMNIFKESLFSSSKSNTTTKNKKTRQHQLRNSKFPEENSSFSEPLLSPSGNDDNSIELGTIDSDDDSETQSNARHVLRSRTIKQPAAPAAHGGGSIVIVEKPVRPNETIQAFAIRYRVPVCLNVYFYLKKKIIFCS
jgi:hypothetical protein